MDFNIQRINEIKSFVKDTKQQLSAHPIYSEIATPEELKIFMESHVFAVWDFMSLVKFLQLKFTSVRVPWIPPSDSSIARLINEIVLDEESDIDQHGKPTSHFELYTDADLTIPLDTSALDPKLELELVIDISPPDSQRN